MSTAADMWNEIDRRIGHAIDEALALLGVENIPQGGPGGPGSAGGVPIHGNANHMPPMALASDLTALEFIDLADTPSSYAGQALRYPRVNAGETALEFHAITASDVGADPAGTAAGLIADLLLEPDPFPQYLTEAEADLLYADIVHTHSAADIVSGTLASARGGTGVSNAGTLTVPSNVSITGGGTIALGGFTLTVPATGTVPLGTGIANQVALWSGTNTVVGDAGLTYNPATDALAVVGTAAIAASAPSTYPFYLTSDQPTLNGSAFGIEIYSSAAAGRFYFARALGSLASPTTVTSGNRLATMDYAGYDGSAFITTAQIQINADAAVSSGIVPGRMLLLTADTTGALVEAMRITSAQHVGIGATPGVRLHVALEDAATSATSEILRIDHNSTGTPGTGYGTRVLFRLESSTTINRNAIAFEAVWGDATDATRTSHASILTVTNAAALAEVARFDKGNGTAANTGFMLWDVDNNTLERVTVGAAGSGGAGFKVLRIPN